MKLLNWPIILNSIMVLISGWPFAVCNAQSADTVSIGAYILDLYQFDMVDNSIKTDLYVWCNYKNKNLNFENELEILDVNEADYFGTSTLETAFDEWWFFTKIKADIRQKYDLSNYPFDHQQIKISFESSEYDLTNMVFVPDVDNSRVSNEVRGRLKEWDLKNVRFLSSVKKYDSNFGNENDANVSFHSSFDILVEAYRKDSWYILFKLITVIIVALTISSCAFFIKPINTDPRFGLCVGGLFAAVGNKYIVEGVAPSNDGVSLLDNVHNLTFIFIFIIIVISVISLAFYEDGTDRSKRISGRIDRVSFFSIVISYLLILSYLIMRSA